MNYKQRAMIGDELKIFDEINNQLAHIKSMTAVLDRTDKKRFHIIGKIIRRPIDIQSFYDHASPLEIQANDIPVSILGKIRELVIEGLFATQKDLEKKLEAMCVKVIKGQENKTEHISLTTLIYSGAIEKNFVVLNVRNICTYNYTRDPLTGEYISESGSSMLVNFGDRLVARIGTATDQSVEIQIMEG